MLVLKVMHCCYGDYCYCFGYYCVEDIAYFGCFVLWVICLEGFHLLLYVCNLLLEVDDFNIFDLDCTFEL